MAIKCIKKEHTLHEDGYVTVCDFVCDTEDDVAKLPKCCTNSKALVVDTGDVYMVNASCNWVKFGG